MADPARFELTTPAFRGERPHLRPTKARPSTANEPASNAGVSAAGTATRCGLLPFSAPAEPLVICAKWNRQDATILGASHRN